MIWQWLLGILIAMGCISKINIDKIPVEFITKYSVMPEDFEHEDFGKTIYKFKNKIEQRVKLVFVENLLSLRASAHTGVAIPRIEGKCIDNCPTVRETLRFLVVIVTWFLSTGGLPRPVCALVSQ